MRKFTTLVKYLLEASGLPREQCSAFADQGDLLLTGRDMGPVYLPDAAMRLLCVCITPKSQFCQPDHLFSLH